MDKQYTVDMLTVDSVSIKSQDQVNIEGQMYLVGEPHRCAYINSASGRAQIAAELPEPYLSAVMAVWGDEPTVPEPEPEAEVSEDGNID